MDHSYSVRAMIRERRREGGMEEGGNGSRKKKVIEKGKEKR